MNDSLSPGRGPPRGPTGLTILPDEALERLLREVHRGGLPCPFGRAQLLARGLNREAEAADLLFGLEARAVRAVLTAVLAERRSGSAPGANRPAAP